MLIYFVIVPILIAVLLYLSPLEKVTRVLAIVVQSGLLAASFFLFYQAREEDITVAIGGYSDIFLGIVLRADPLAAVFILLTAFIFLMVVLYTFSDNQSRLFWFLLFIWEAALIGVFLAGDLFNIFVMTEVMTVVVAVLIMYDRKNRSMYDGIIYLMINIVVIQFYLLGLGYFYRIVGIMDMQGAAAMVAEVDPSQLVLPYALIMTFVALKCAFMPVYGWLPKAHSTPGAFPAVSAVLSGLHIKSGVYLFLRFQDMFGDVAISEFYVLVGLVTAFSGVIFAISQKDIKKVLAYSTIAQVGLIVAGLNLGGEQNFAGGLFHSINHALFKAALFLISGVIAHAYGTRDVNKIRGVFSTMPIVGFTTMLAIFGIAGMPFFNGSISKYFLMYDVSGPLYWAMSLVNLGTIMICIKLGLMLFGKPLPEHTPSEAAVEHEELDGWKQLPILVLAGMCFAFGVFGEFIMSFLFNFEFGINWLGFGEKAGIFVITVSAAVLIFKFA